MCALAWCLHWPTRIVLPSSDITPNNSDQRYTIATLETIQLLQKHLLINSSPPIPVYISTDLDPPDEHPTHMEYPDNYADHSTPYRIIEEIQQDQVVNEVR